MIDKKHINYRLVINVLGIVLIIGLSLFVYFYFKEDFELLKTKEGIEAFINKIKNTGLISGLILIIIQTLQVIVAFIPGEFVEIASGVLFGPFVGTILCLVGLNLGTIIIFYLVKLFGKGFVKDNVSEKEYKYLKFLEDPNRALVILFFIFLIPGIPKDILIYLVPLTKVKLSRFMIVSSIARIPSILPSTIIGMSILEQNYVLAIVIFVVFLVIAIIGIIFNKHIYGFIERKFLNKSQH